MICFYHREMFSASGCSKRGGLGLEERILLVGSRFAVLVVESSHKIKEKKEKTSPETQVLDSESWNLSTSSR